MSNQSKPISTLDFICLPAEYFTEGETFNIGKDVCDGPVYKHDIYDEFTGEVIGTRYTCDDPDEWGPYWWEVLD